MRKDKGQDKIRQRQGQDDDEHKTDKTGQQHKDNSNPEPKPKNTQIPHFCTKAINKPSFERMLMNNYPLGLS
jgi:hypothetical protein